MEEYPLNIKTIEYAGKTIKQMSDERQGKYFYVTKKNGWAIKLE